MSATMAGLNGSTWAKISIPHKQNNTPLDALPVGANLVSLTRSSDKRNEAEALVTGAKKISHAPPARAQAQGLETSA